MKLTREERLLQLDSISNIRDLGGYETNTGSCTKPKRFLRSAVMSTISDEDLAAIYDYGVRVVVDLRSDKEVETEPNRMRDYKDVKYHQVNLLNAGSVNVAPKHYSDMGDMYVNVIEDNKAQFKELFELFDQYDEECIVFHCSAGKDRTGMTAAMLLDLAGVADADIVQDYSETFENNKAINAMLLELVSSERRHFLLSEPEYMERFLKFVKDNYGSVREYLLSIGIEAAAIDRLQEKLG